MPPALTSLPASALASDDARWQASEASALDRHALKALPFGAFALTEPILGSATASPLAPKLRARHELAIRGRSIAMTAFRAKILTAACLPFVVLASPVAAQVDDSVVLTILRQCARIDEATARHACFDNNIRLGNTDVPRASVPGGAPHPQAGGVVLPNGPADLRSEDVRGPGQSDVSSDAAEEFDARVSSATEQNVGMYLITLEDGTQWLFTESVGLSYRPPTAGTTVTINRASLGSYLLVAERQRPVRVRRVR